MNIINTRKTRRSLILSAHQILKFGKNGSSLHRVEKVIGHVAVCCKVYKTFSGVCIIIPGGDIHYYFNIRDIICTVSAIVIL